MRKYGGVVIHAGRDSEGLLEIVEAHGVRSLHFGTPPRQSAMCLAEPDRLELPYLRSMLTALLFAGSPRRVLVLGLGGGSLCKFLLREFPECRIDAVDAREAVAALASRYFGLPEDPRLSVHIGDAGDFLRGTGTDGGYDQIFVDLFDPVGLAGALSEPDFFAVARGRLDEAGVLAANLWRTQPEQLRAGLALLGRSFEGGSRRLDVMGRGNVIGFGLGPRVPPLSRREAERRAARLERQLSVEFTRFLPLLSTPP